ncbi:MAG TPA: DUF4157 domain-containing protein [Methanosarcina sp.]|nr:DUF4157 domain-containing protein [Methanosarcina sp.]
MERQLVTKPGISEAKTNDYRSSSLSHKPNFQVRGFLHSRNNLSNKPKLSPTKLRTKLEVSQPGDSYEQEAEQVDEQVMRIPEPSVSSIEFSKIPVFPDQVQRKCSNSCKQKPSFNSSGSLANRILQPQITAGNQAVQRLIKSGALQAKLKISQPNDIYEQEADRVSEKVMRMPDPEIQKKQKCPLRNDALCKEDKIDEITVMRKEAGAQIRPSSFQDNILFRQQKSTKPELSTTPKSYDEKSAPVFALPLIHRLVYYKDTDSYNDLVTGVRYSRKELENYAESARNQINRYRKVISILHCKLKELQGNPLSENPNKPANEYISEAFYEEAQKSFSITSNTIGGYTKAGDAYVQDFCSIVMPETEENPFFIFPFWQHERSHQKTCLSNKENYRKNGLSDLAANVEVADEFNEPIFLIMDEINSYEVTVRELEKELSVFFSGSIDTASKGPMSLPETYSIHRKASLDQSESIPYTRTSVLPDIHDVLRSSGQSLDTQTRSFFEFRLGYDFSDVRVHTDGKAAESARAVDALAYTVGKDIVFKERKYAPETVTGRQLLAHELTHVVQQSMGNNDRLCIMREQATTASTNYYQWNLQQPRSLTQTLDPTLISKDELICEIELIKQWLWNNPAPGAERDNLLKVLSSLEQPKHEARPSVVTEKERKEKIEALKQKGKNIDVSIYTHYKGMDTAEAILEGIAKGRETRKVSDAALPMEYFEDIGIILSEISKQSGGAINFVRELHLMGHGRENEFGFGRYFYKSEDLKNYKTGLYADYMTEGATIYMEGCDVAAGETGLKYLKEVGRIFFGNKKSGYLKGNTCEIHGIGEMTECGPRTLRWPSDFR